MDRTLLLAILLLAAPLAGCVTPDAANNTTTDDPASEGPGDGTDGADDTGETGTETSEDGSDQGSEDAGEQGSGDDDENDGSDAPQDPPADCSFPAFTQATEGEDTGSSSTGGNGSSEDGNTSTEGNETATTPEGLHALVCTNHGGFVLELFGNRTPQTVQNFGSLSQDGYYDEVKFHRVIGPRKAPPNGFMIQGGDPNTKSPETQNNRWGTGGPGYTIIDEFACHDGTTSHNFTSYQSSEEPCDGHDGLALTHHKAGMVSMANTGRAKTGGSQFFITLTATPHLDGTHPVFGAVVDGMEVVRSIGDVETDRRDKPIEPVVIESIEIVGELPGVTLQKY